MLRNYGSCKHFDKHWKKATLDPLWYCKMSHEVFVLNDSQLLLHQILAFVFKTDWVKVRFVLGKVNKLRYIVWLVLSSSSKKKANLIMTKFPVHFKTQLFSLLTLAWVMKYIILHQVGKRSEM